MWVTNTVAAASCDHFGKSDNINRMLTLTNEFYLSISGKLKCDHTNPPTTLTSDYMTHNQVHIFFLIKKQKIEHKTVSEFQFRWFWCNYERQDCKNQWKNAFKFNLILPPAGKIGA